MNEGAQGIEVEEPEDHLGMTPEQWVQFKAFTSGFGDRDENDVDDLIAMKRTANRPKAQNHILESLALKKLFERQAQTPKQS